MKIAHITCTYPPYKGGIGNVTYNFARRLRDRGHDICVITPEYHKKVSNEGIDDGVLVRRLRPALLKFGNSAFLPQIPKHLKGYDVIHLHWPFFGVEEVLFWYLKHNRHKRFVMTYHMDFLPPSLFTRFMAWPSMRLLPSLVKRADFVTCSSTDYVKNSPQAGRLYRKQPEKFIEVPFGADPAFHKETIRDEMYARFGFDKKRPAALFVGGLDKAHYFKGVHTFLDAAKLHPDIQWVVVGDGDLRSSYQVYAEKQKNVFFLGALSLNDLVSVVNMATVSVLPSVNAGEAYGIVLVEAMACGNPLVASDLPGVQTLVDDGVNGYLVKPKDAKDLADKISSIVSNPDTIKDMGEASFQKFQKFYQWSRILDTLEGAYENLR